MWKLWRWDEISDVYDATIETEKDVMKEETHQLVHMLQKVRWKSQNGKTSNDDLKDLELYRKLKGLRNTADVGQGLLEAILCLSCEISVLIQFFKPKKEKPDGDFRDRFFNMLRQHSVVNLEAEVTPALPLIFLWMAWKQK